MSHETSLTQEEARTEAWLGQLHPATSAQGRDKLMFQAGRASAGHVQLWQRMSGVFAMLLACSLMIHTSPSKPEPKIMAPQVASSSWQPPEEIPTRIVDEQAYINVRHSVLTHGLGALPETRSGRSVPADHMRYGDAFERYLSL